MKMKILIMMFTLMPLLSGFTELKPSGCEINLIRAEGLDEHLEAIAKIYNENKQKSWIYIHGILPNPESFGEYDSYEVIAYIPGKKSWLIPMQSVTTNEATHWIGKHEFSPKQLPDKLKIRLIHSKTRKKGPILFIQNELSCKKS